LAEAGVARQFQDSFTNQSLTKLRMAPACLYLVPKRNI